MPHDFGVRRGRTAVRGARLGIVAAAALATVILAQNWRYHRDIEHEQGWVSAGQPCPRISAAAYAARGYRTRERTTDVEGLTMARQFGHVMCKDVDTPGRLGLVTHPVCQFTSPTAIRVARGPFETFFEPGPGQVATVSAAPGGATCALAGRFTLFSDPTN